MAGLGPFGPSAGNLGGLPTAARGRLCAVTEGCFFATPNFAPCPPTKLQLLFPSSPTPSVALGRSEGGSVLSQKVRRCYKGSRSCLSAWPQLGIDNRSGNTIDVWDVIVRTKYGGFGLPALC